MLAALAPGCLEDLAEPLACLPPPETPGAARACLDAVLKDSDAFDTQYCTTNPEVLSCYRDPARGCGCDDDCSQVEASCHPAPDCPPEVLAAHPTAKCRQFQPEDVGPFVSEGEQCLCGCEACLIICDGRGPIWSQVDFADPDTGISLTPAGLLTLDLRRHLPDVGKAGIYVRARGLTARATMDASDVYVPPTIYGVADDVNDPFVVGVLPPVMSDRFEGEILPTNQLLSWTQPSDKPTLMGFSNNLGTFSVYEIDCIVPFVVE